MKKFLIITTINSPTEAVYKFLDILWDCWKVIIVWDRKWPIDYIKHEKLIFLDIEKQYELYPEFSYSIPEKHYARKNIWYYHAIKLWADYIAETDDDNIPYDFYPKFIDEKNYQCDVIDDDWSVNIYSYFTDKKIWPRWLDLNYINNKPNSSKIFKRFIKPFIQHSLEDKDPDVDAIYRLVFWEEIIFDRDKKIALWKNTWCPFNTQNTYWHKEAFPFLYIPHTVVRRASDIWKSYIAQRWVKEFWWTVLFQSPTVYQERNDHNLQIDFNEEIVCYKDACNIIKDLSSLKLNCKDSKDIVISIYQYLIDKWYFTENEMNALSLWIKLF